MAEFVFAFLDDVDVCVFCGCMEILLFDKIKGAYLFLLGRFWDRRDSWASFSPCSTSDGRTGTSMYLVFEGIFIQHKSYESFSKSTFSSFQSQLLKY